MNIGIVGSGKIGSTVARLAVDAGHDVIVANSRGPGSLDGLIAELGEHATAGTVPQAAASDLTVVAIPLKAYRDLDRSAFVGSNVIDTSNYYPDRDGHIAGLDADETTSSELVREQWLPNATLVKALNTIRYKELTARADRDAPSADRLAVPVAADDDVAKQRAIEFIDSLGLAGVDVGDLAAGRRLQPGSAVYVKTLTPAELGSQFGLG